MGQRSGHGPKPSPFTTMRRSAGVPRLENPTEVIVGVSQVTAGTFHPTSSLFGCPVPQRDHEGVTGHGTQSADLDFGRRPDQVVQRVIVPRVAPLSLPQPGASSPIRKFDTSPENGRATVGPPKPCLTLHDDRVVAARARQAHRMDQWTTSRARGVGHRRNHADRQCARHAGDCNGERHPSYRVMVAQLNREPGSSTMAAVAGSGAASVHWQPDDPASRPSGQAAPVQVTPDSLAPPRWAWTRVASVRLASVRSESLRLAL